MNEYIFGVALVSVLWGIVSAMVMVGYLSNRGQKINVPFFRIYIIKYIHQYAKMTTEENGRPGVWFYSFIIAMNLALICTIIGLLA